MLRPDEIDKLHIQLWKELLNFPYTLEGVERIIQAINLAGYKVVKADE